MHEMSTVWVLLVFLADWRVNYHFVAPCMCSHIRVFSGPIPIHNRWLMRATLSYISKVSTYEAYKHKR